MASYGDMGRDIPGDEYLVTEDYRSSKLSITGRFLGSEKLWLTFILLSGLTFRLLVFFKAGDSMFLGTDDDNYRESAEILIREGVLTYAGWKEPTVFIMPGYPVFLAVVFLAAGSVGIFAVKVLQVLVSAAAVGLAVGLGTAAGGTGVGLLAGLFLAVYPPNLTAPSFLLTEVLFSFFLLAAVCTFIRVTECRSGKRLVLTGLLLGLSTYFRPTSGLLPAIFGLHLLLRGRSWQRVIYAAGIMTVVLVLVLSPWMVRNYAVYGEFIPFTVSGGNPFLRGTYVDEKINEPFPWVKGARHLSDRAQMEYGRERVVQGFREDFRTYLRWYTVGKFKVFWEKPYYYKELPLLPGEPVRQLHTFLLLLGAGGLVLGVWRRNRVMVLFTLICGYFTLLHMVYLPAPRYSYPVMQLVIIASAYFFVEGIRVVTTGVRHNRR